MAILDYLKSFTPTLKRSDVLEDVRLTLKELDETVIPNYNNAVDFFKSSRLSSATNRELGEMFYAEFKVKGPKRSTFIGDISDAIVNLRKNVDYIYKDFDKLLEADVIAQGLNMRSAFAVRFADYASFMTNYAIDLLSYVYFFEVQQKVGVNDSIDIEINPVTIKKVNDNMFNFSKLLNMYACEHNDFVKINKNIVDVLAMSNPEALASVYDRNQLDPMPAALMPGFIPNPIYHFRMMIAEYQLRRYKANEDKKKALELRLMHLQLVKEGKNDARIEKQIAYTQDRIDRISRSMADTEESLGIDRK